MTHTSNSHKASSIISTLKMARIYSHPIRSPIYISICFLDSLLPQIPQKKKKNQSKRWDTKSRNQPARLLCLCFTMTSFQIWDSRTYWLFLIGLELLLIDEQVWIHCLQVDIWLHHLLASLNGDTK